VDEKAAIADQLVVPIGTQVVLRAETVICEPDQIHVKGQVAEIIQNPGGASRSYRVRFADGTEATVLRDGFSILKQMKAGPLLEAAAAFSERDLEQFIIFRCIVGSQAYGLGRETSDIDRRGIYLPPAHLQWSLYGVPEQLENPALEECYWELKKFIVLALKANPNILECLFTPLVEQSSEIADELLASRQIFLSKLVYQTYSGYVMSQFKKLEQDLRTRGEIKWKHAMHLIRLLIQGIGILRNADVPVRISEHRTSLLGIRDGRMSWSEVNTWRLLLHREFDEAFAVTALPDMPNYEDANRLLVMARRRMAEVDSGS
jgi:uncharacterized protein